MADLILTDGDPVEAEMNIEQMFIAGIDNEPGVAACAGALEVEEKMK